MATMPARMMALISQDCGAELGVPRDPFVSVCSDLTPVLVAVDVLFVLSWLKHRSVTTEEAAKTHQVRQGNELPLEKEGGEAYSRFQ